MGNRRRGKGEGEWEKEEGKEDSEGGGESWGKEDRQAGGEKGEWFMVLVKQTDLSGIIKWGKRGHVKESLTVEGKQERGGERAEQHVRWVNFVDLIGFPTIPLGIFRGERGKKKGRNYANSCTFLFLTPSTIIFGSENFSFIGKTKLVLLHSLNGTIHGCGQLKMSLFPGHVSFLQCQHLQIGTCFDFG